MHQFSSELRKVEFSEFCLQKTCETAVSRCPRNSIPGAEPRADYEKAPRPNCFRCLSCGHS